MTQNIANRIQNMGSTVHNLDLFLGKMADYGYPGYWSLTRKINDNLGKYRDGSR